MKERQTHHLDMYKIAKINVALLTANPSIWRVANSMLHALNFSSKNKKFYDPLLAGKYGVALALEHLVRSLANVMVSCGFIGPSFFGDPIPQRTEILFISHLNRPADYSAPSDQYFGPIPDKVALDGIASVVVMLNKCRARKTAINSAPSSHAAMRVVCAPYLSPVVEAWHFLMLLLTGIGAAFKALVEFDSARRRVGVFAGLAQASARSLIGLRFRHQVLRLIKKTRPRKIVFTYEGHPWERLICQVVRAKFPNIELIGYQHSIVLPGPKAMSSNIALSLTPHKLMVTSTMTADLLRNDGGVVPDKIIPVGSTKFIDPPSQMVCKAADSLLVVPEGTPEDTLPMVEFAIALGHLLRKQGSELTVTLRLHPLLNFDWLKTHCKVANRLPDNVIFSSRSLAEDAMAAGWILYRGSTAVFCAIPFGGRPLFLEFDGDAAANDPLAMAGTYRQSVKSIRSAMHVMLEDKRKRHEAGDDGHISAEQQMLIDFAVGYFPALDEHGFLEELRQANSSNG